ncbi:hypothetical protein NPIL_602041 [Nephila pilipes]|uniref:Uncharacterized protein n=1 Tax=Nephila pilipes TaxID=299642 RepID=A0A8X6NHG1_NEPPI|nr:hypothetical protein NPIL_602041 [Nephila pilipes]
MEDTSEKYFAAVEREAQPVFNRGNRNSKFLPEWQPWVIHGRPEMYSEPEENAFLDPRINSKFEPGNTGNNLGIKRANPIFQTLQLQKISLKTKRRHKFPKSIQKKHLAKDDKVSVRSFKQVQCNNGKISDSEYKSNGGYHLVKDDKISVRSSKKIQCSNGEMSVRGYGSNEGSNLRKEKSSNQESDLSPNTSKTKKNISDIYRNNQSNSEEEFRNFVNEVYITENSSSYSTESTTSIHIKILSSKKPKSEKRNYNLKNKHLKNHNYIHNLNSKNKNKKNSLGVKHFQKSSHINSDIPKLKTHKESRKKLNSKTKNEILAPISTIQNSQDQKRQFNMKEENLENYRNFQDSSLNIDPFRVQTNEQYIMNKNLLPKLSKPSVLTNYENSKGIHTGNVENQIDGIHENSGIQKIFTNSDTKISDGKYSTLDESHSAHKLMHDTDEKYDALKEIRKETETEKPLKTILKNLYTFPESNLKNNDENVNDIPFVSKGDKNIDNYKMKSIPRIYLRSVSDSVPYFIHNENFNLPTQRNQELLHYYQMLPNNEQEQFMHSIPPLKQNSRYFNDNTFQNNNNRYGNFLPNDLKITHISKDPDNIYRKNYEEMNLTKKLSKLLEDFKVKEIILTDPKTNVETDVIEDRKQNVVDNIRIFNNANRKLPYDEFSNALKLSAPEKQAITELPYSWRSEDKLRIGKSTTKYPFIIPKVLSKVPIQHKNSITSGKFSHKNEQPKNVNDLLGLMSKEINHNTKKERNEQKSHSLGSYKNNYITFNKDPEPVTNIFDSNEKIFPIKSENEEMEYNNDQVDSLSDRNQENQDYDIHDMNGNHKSGADKTDGDYNNEENFNSNKGPEYYESSLRLHGNNMVGSPKHILTDSIPEIKKNRLHSGPPSFNDGFYKANFKTPHGYGSIETKNYYFSTDISAADDFNEFQKEEMVEKESKTMLRNKLMSSNESSHQFKEKKTEIKDNKENYHEAFIEEKDHSKYPNQPNFNINKNNLEERSISSTESQNHTNLIDTSESSDEKISNRDLKQNENHLQNEDQTIQSGMLGYPKSYPGQRKIELGKNVSKFSKNPPKSESTVVYDESERDDDEYYSENVSDYDATEDLGQFNEQKIFYNLKNDNRNPSSAQKTKHKFYRDTSNNSYANETDPEDILSENKDEYLTDDISTMIGTSETELALVSTDPESERIPSQLKKNKLKFNIHSNNASSLKKRSSSDDFHKLEEISGITEIRPTESGELQEVSALLSDMDSMNDVDDMVKKRREEESVSTDEPEKENKNKDLNPSYSGNVVYITMKTTTMDLEQRFNGD